jgi:hypothetical protein
MDNSVKLTEKYERKSKSSTCNQADYVDSKRRHAA